MKKFLAVYTGTQESRAKWDGLPEAQRHQREAAGMAGWHKWIEDHKSSIVEMGAPLGRTKLVSRSGVSDIRNNLAAFTVVQAESQEAAAKLFLEHPHFTLFPGDGVEVMECLPIPGM